ncbi:glycoside hydrolase family 15 protein [Chloroflexota bacterium]
MAYRPISDYGIIGNMQSAALVAGDGSVDWCCLPRFDSPSVFAAILDGEKGGNFQICPVGRYSSSQAYLEDTNVLQATFETDAGTAVLTDFMPCYRTGGGRLRQPLEIHRRIECTGGKVGFRVDFRPEFDYARVPAGLQISRHGVVAAGGADALNLSSSVPLRLDKRGVAASFSLNGGETAVFVMSYGTGQPSAKVLGGSVAKLEETTRFWARMAVDCEIDGPWREAIVRSYLILHLLVYSPTGAIIAAPTCSLPERMGGGRNWDYRYAWLRDASWTLTAFGMLGHHDEAARFFGWLVEMERAYGPEIRILYGIDEESRLEENELGHLEGYRGSRPVRIGNAAAGQRQLDIFGSVLDTAYAYHRSGGYISSQDWRLLVNLVDTACRRWRQPDSGIWEVRGGARHFVHSKFMCWVALDRGIKLAESTGYEANVNTWQRNAAAIRRDIIQKGWDDKQEAFVQHYGSGALDAANLLMPLFGFLQMEDPRMAATVRQTVQRLSRDGLLLRYDTGVTDDGLAGGEGAFLWCSFWLVRVFVRQGRLEEARKLYEKLLSYRNRLGLLSEMVDPATGELLGNFPQALSHLAVIIAGVELKRALSGRGP